MRNQAALPGSVCCEAQKRGEKSSQTWWVFDWKKFHLVQEPQPWQVLRDALKMITVVVASGVQRRHLTIMPFIFFPMLDSKVPF